MIAALCITSLSERYNTHLCEWVLLHALCLTQRGKNRIKAICQWKLKRTKKLEPLHIKQDTRNYKTETIIFAKPR